LFPQVTHLAITKGLGGLSFGGFPFLLLDFMSSARYQQRGVLSSTLFLGSSLQGFKHGPVLLFLDVPQGHAVDPGVGFDRGIHNPDPRGQPPTNPNHGVPLGP
jgi:hypothetical protein